MFLMNKHKSDSDLVAGVAKKMYKLGLVAIRLGLE